MALKIPEPSDICFDAESNHYYIVSDHGKLYECELDGTIIRKAQKEGMDFEGVLVKDSFVYVSDETPRKVLQYKKSDLSFVKSYTVTWGGAMNKAFESITYNNSKNCFVLISEQPPTIVEYNNNFEEIARYRFHNAQDISAATWHNGQMYLLSDIDANIIKCDPVTYTPITYYKINVLNPEGITFGSKEKISIVSDRAGKLYFFDTLPIIKHIK